MQWLAEICVRRPVFATMLIMSLVVVGAFSFFSLGVDLFPKVDFPTITVTVVNPGVNSGIAVANAPGGNNNLALGFFGKASAGNGGTSRNQR